MLDKSTIKILMEEADNNRFTAVQLALKDDTYRAEQFEVARGWDRTVCWLLSLSDAEHETT